MNVYADLFGIDRDLDAMADEIEKRLSAAFAEIDHTCEFNQLKVIKAMQENRVSDSHFSGTTGYGYDDRGRDVLDRVYADAFDAEDALVRHQIVSGTQAISICLFGNLRPGDELLSVTGKPYDTLEEVIGIRNPGRGSLKDFGITYLQVEPDGNGIDAAAVRNAVNPRTKMIFIQRSKGYSSRKSLTAAKLAEAIREIRKIREDLIIMVDNCYGEFTEKSEPTQAGADLMAGSLIKNPGGGLAPSGGYVAGKRRLVENAAYCLTAPGIGRKVGSTAGLNRLLFQGFFMAPHVVAQSLKGAIFCAEIMKNIGYPISPDTFEERGDIIQSIEFGSAEALIMFCQGIQKGSPVDSHVTPQPWEMPGYESRVIMAAGGFVQGASIELSADAPLVPPYTAYVQGGLVYEHVKLGVLFALQNLRDGGILR